MNDQQRVQLAWEAGFWAGVEAARAATFGVAMPMDWLDRAENAARLTPDAGDVMQRHYEDGPA